MTERIVVTRLLRHPMDTLCVAALAAVLLSCACQNGQRHVPTSQPVTAEEFWPIQQSPFDPGQPPRYVMYPGDMLLVRFPSDPELDTQARIRSDGMISIPHVGDIVAAGREPMELARELEARMEGVLKRQVVSVIVTEELGRRVYIGGDVRRPGGLQLAPNQTLSQALFEAGGLPGTAAPECILVLRQRPEASYVLKADLNRILEGTAPDVRLEPFDVVFVPETIITKIDRFVEQYVNSLIPRSVAFPFTTELRSAPVRVIDGNQSAFPVTIRR
jgi:protein involved in polysaccharide export with SLBB domain